MGTDERDVEAPYRRLRGRPWFTPREGRLLMAAIFAASKAEKRTDPEWEALYRKVARYYGTKDEVEL